MTCKHTNTKKVAVPAPHWNKLVCADCNKWLRWLGKEDKPKPTKPSEAYDDRQSVQPKDPRSNLFGRRHVRG